MGRKVRRSATLEIVLDAAKAGSLQRQIGAQLRAAILERRLLPGTLLPSSRLMAAEFNCARGTVSAAIEQLVAEGYLVSPAASGITVAANLPDDILTAPAVNAAPAPVVRPVAVEREEPASFPVGQPDREALPFPLWAKLLEREWRRPGWAIAGTPDPFGNPGLQQAVAQHLGAARGFICGPEAVVITGGVRQSIALFARVVLGAGDAAWIEDPGYPGMQEGLAEAGIRPVPVPIDAAGFSVAAGLELAPEARLAVVVVPSHHFPLGAVLTLQRRLELLHWAERPAAGAVAGARSERPGRLSRELFEDPVSGAAVELPGAAGRAGRGGAAGDCEQGLGGVAAGSGRVGAVHRRWSFRRAPAAHPTAVRGAAGDADRGRVAPSRRPAPHRTRPGRHAFDRPACQKRWLR